MSEQVKRYTIRAGMPETAALFLPPVVVSASDYDALAQQCRELQEDRQRTADELVAFVHGEHSAVCAERDTLRTELDQLRRWEKEVRENSPLLIRLDSAEAERDALRGLLAECAEYLNTNNLTSIGHGSILHRKMIDAAMEVPR